MLLNPLILGRRAFLTSAAASILVGSSMRPGIAADATAPAALTTPQVNLPLTEQLLHTAVRLVCPINENSFESGTGFFFAFFTEPTGGVPVIVTNKHVVRGHETCVIVFTGQKKDGTPDLDVKLPVTFTDFSKRWIGHPDPNVDLVVIPIADVLNQFATSGTPAFIKTCSDAAIPTVSAMAALTPLEDILTVGFPGLLWDAVHNLPVFHRGITASPPYVDFNGYKEFLIDAAVWPGASGSPVYLYERGALLDERGNSTSFGSRLMLLGIVYGSAIQDVTGELLVEEAPTKPTVHSGIPSNLGICIRSSRIFDFQPLLIAHGAKVPKSYAMRTSDG